MKPVLSLHDVYFSRRLARGSSGRSLEVFRALDLEISDGDRVGLLGPNGAGKSTLLRLMAGILEPDRGAIRCSSPVRVILDPSVGLDPVLTGRENARSMLLLQGLPIGLANHAMDGIKQFSELDDFFDEPVKTYSAGMTTRLVVATQLGASNDAGLLIDEGFGMADAKFQSKVLQRCNEIFSGVPFLVLATHSLPMLDAFCTRGVVLHQGRVAFDGELSSAVRYYSENVTHS